MLRAAAAWYAGGMSHPLARRSRARRRLILSRSAADPAAAALRRVEVARQYLFEALRGERPLTWAVVGADLAGDDPGLAARLEHRLRKRWGRADDTVVSAVRAGDRPSALLASLDARALRHDPAVVVVAVGPLPEAARDAELAALRELLAALDRAGAAAVVLPPAPSGAGERLTLSAAEESLRRRVEKAAILGGAVPAPTAECGTPALLAAALFRAVGLDRPRPKTSPLSQKLAVR